MWIDKCQLVRPKQLTKIKPKGPTGDQKALSDTQVEFRALCANIGPFHPRREQPGRGANHNPGYERSNIALPFETSLPPPKQHQQSHWKRCCHGLAKERQDK